MSFHFARRILFPPNNGQMEQLRRVGQLGWVRQILSRELTRPLWSISNQSTGNCGKSSNPSSAGNRCDLIGNGIVSGSEFSSVGSGRTAFSVLTLNNIAPNPGAHRRAVSRFFLVVGGLVARRLLCSEVLKATFLVTIATKEKFQSIDRGSSSRVSRVLERIYKRSHNCRSTHTFSLLLFSSQTLW